MRYILSLYVLVSFFACTKTDNSPEGVIRNIVSAFGQKVVDKNFYEEVTAGDLHELMKSATTEDMDNYFLESSPVNPKVKVLKKTCSTSSKCMVTYVISYKHKKDANIASLVEVKKLAEVVMKDGLWKVANIVNLKTYIENKEAISM